MLSNMFQSFHARMFAAILAGIICVPGFAYAQRPFPIENGVLTTDLNGGSHAIANVTNMTATKFFGDGANLTNVTATSTGGNGAFTGSFNGTHIGNGSGLTNVTATLPGNLVYTDLSNQTITGNLTTNGTVTKNLSSSTGNMAVNGTNLVFDTGDVFLNGGDVAQIGNLSGTGNNSFGGGNISLGNATVIKNARYIINNIDGTGIGIDPTNNYVITTTNSGSYSVVTTSAFGLNLPNFTSTIGPRHDELYTTSAISYYRGWQLSGVVRAMRMGLSGNNIQLSISDNAGVPYSDSFIFDAGVTVNANRTLVLPNTVNSTNTTIAGTNFTISPTSLSITGNLIQTGTSSFNGSTTIQSKFTIKQGFNHDVDAVSNGTSTNQMSFVKITATGNFTVHTGASGDTITYKNYSGGVVTLLGTGNATFDGNSSLSLPDKSAVNLTSDGAANWLVH